MKLKLVGFSDKDKLTFESILAIAEARLNKAWHISETMGNADFYLLSSRLRTQFADDKLLNTLPRQQCIFCSTESTDVADYELLVDNNNIPYLKALVTLFNRIGTESDDSHSKADSQRAVGNSESARDVPVDTVEAEEVPAQTTRSRGFFVKEKVLETEPKPVDNNRASANSEVRSRGFFTKFSQQETGQESEPDVSKAVAAIEQSSYFDPLETPFIRHLLTKTENILLLGITDIDPLYIDLATKSYYSASSLEQLQPYFSPDNELSVQTRTDSQLQYAIASEGLKPQALSGLLWYSVFTRSQGRVITGHKATDVVRLTRWPDINLPGCRKLIKLAAYMHSNAVDLQTVQVQTGIPMEKIYDFYNACKVINLIEVCQSKDVHEKSMDEQQRELYEKIGKRINLTLDHK